MQPLDGSLYTYKLQDKLLKVDCKVNQTRTLYFRLKASDVGEAMRRGQLNLCLCNINRCQETSGYSQPKGQEDHPDSPTDAEGLNNGF